MDRTKDNPDVTDAERIAELEAAQRATLDDGTVDPFLFAAALADLLPAVPGMPSNSDLWPGRDNA